MWKQVRPQFAAFFLLSLWGIVTVLIFINLMNKADRDIRGRGAALATSFQKSWVSRPDTHAHLFRKMRENYFNQLEPSQPYFERVILTWINPVTKNEVILHPPPWIGKDPESLVTLGSIRVPLESLDSQPGRVSGYLYFQIDPWERRSTPVMFLLAALNVLLLLLILLYRLFRVGKGFEETRFELAQKKEELIHLEQLALAGQLTAGLLHDLKKPVIHIREECLESPTDARLADIGTHSELFLSMLRQSGLEGFARRKTAQPEYCDVIDLVRKSLDLVQYERSDVEVNLDMDEKTPFIWAHPTRIMQVLSNLFLNAYEAMQGRGTLSIHVRPGTGSGGRVAGISVSDTGPGVSSEDLERIFEPFFTSGKDGSGLGLYITRTILEEMGGEVSVECPSAGGTTFHLRLPEGQPPGSV